MTGRLSRSKVCPVNRPAEKVHSWSSLLQKTQQLLSFNGVALIIVFIRDEASIQHKEAGVTCTEDTKQTSQSKQKLRTTEGASVCVGEIYATRWQACVFRPTCPRLAHYHSLLLLLFVFILFGFSVLTAVIKAFICLFKKERMFKPRIPFNAIT